MTAITEKLLEDGITVHLATHGGYCACKLGTDQNTRARDSAR